MKIKMIRNTFIHGEAVSIGDEREMESGTARMLIGCGRAVEIKDTPPAPLALVEGSKKPQEPLDTRDAIPPGEEAAAEREAIKTEVLAFDKDLANEDAPLVVIDPELYPAGPLKKLAELLRLPPVADEADAALRERVADRVAALFQA